MMEKTSQHNQGFTLFEILIALFIFATVVSMIFASYTGTFRIIEETESRAEIYEMARIALQRLREDIESTYYVEKEDEEKEETKESDEEPPRTTRIMGENKEIDGRDADTLDFFSRSHLVLDEADQESGIAEINYDLSDGGEEVGFILRRSDRMVFKSKPGSDKNADRLILCDGLYSVNFTYYDTDGGEHESWDSDDDTQEEKVPSMVAISLEFLNDLDPENPLKFMTRVALPMARVSDEKPR